ncbi:MAG TPA: hypothetical protein VFU15_11600 [Bacteroidia bacterium]|nr:hypothetical protein [Bacteroidia bacterium]
MIVPITEEDRRRNPSATKGKDYKLVSVTSGRVLGYGSIEELKKRERQVQYFKHKKTNP